MTAPQRYTNGSMTYCPDLTVVIACFRQAHELALTLTSFLEQDLPFSRYEILVIDDHSPDHAARDRVARFRQDWPQANLIYVRQYRTNGPDYGASARVKNVGIRLARGKVVFFNNAEIAQAGQSMSYILDAMAASDVPLCLRGRVIDLPYEVIAGKTPAQREARHDATDRAKERVATADHAGLAAMPRDLLTRIGGNDERFDYWGKEDLDLAARLKRIGVKYVYSEDLKSFHISHPANHVKQGDYLRMCALLEENNEKELIEANAGVIWGQLTAPPASMLHGSVILEADEDTASLLAKLETLYYGPNAHRLEIFTVCRDVHRRAVEAALAPRFRALALFSLAEMDAENLATRVLAQVRTKRLAWIPREAPVGVLPWSRINCNEMQYLIAPKTLPLESAKTHDAPARGWLASTALLRTAQQEAASVWDPLRVADVTGLAGRPISWPSPRAEFAQRPAPGNTASPLHGNARILALVPHFGCEPWLEQCLNSLVGQTRPLDAVVVIDDASDQPPKEIVARFPGVTLMRSPHNVGPYRLNQAVITASGYDGYLFQDADDWSTSDRLALLLEEAQRAGAELIGSQELRVLCDSDETMPVCYPLDANLALAEKPGHPLLHPTSLVSRDLFLRAGGFATGLRFGGDTEFLLRASWVGRIVNIPDYCYFRRKRENSLTTNRDTGLQSPARLELLGLVKTRAYANMQAVARGESPDLTPCRTADPIQLEHVLGPELLSC